MTDNEIIKALKLCVTNDYFGHNCKVCPFKPHGAVCTSVMLRCVFELINRQKAEIEALRMDNQQLQSDIANANMNADHALAEIERLTNTQRIYPNDFCGVLCDFAEERIAKAKAQAIKEFAERVKLLNQENLIIWNEHIDNLAKEMVGDASG